ncbi:MAG TPA: MBL fold metallo-hydrolase [Acidimicrobiia bacterium]|nr:MBL fold metallo-hydrolase [Acidimicrobiia bacterium]
MRFRLWGTRGSIAAAGPHTVRYGGDTSAVEVSCGRDQRIILDGGSGIRPIPVDEGTERIDILLSHLHMDHVQGLPFFPALLAAEIEVHVWGPISTTRTLRERLARYLSPPLFPVRVRDLPNVLFHDVVPGEFSIGDIGVRADLIAHPGATLGYRLTEGGASLVYMPDHEPALGSRDFPGAPEWTSGFDLAHGADVLIHDAQYDDDEYEARVGWGHSSISQLAAFADMTEAGKLVSFHHDPVHGDDRLDEMHERLAGLMGVCHLVPGMAGLQLEV